MGPNGLFLDETNEMIVRKTNCFQIRLICGYISVLVIQTVWSKFDKAWYLLFAELCDSVSKKQNKGRLREKRWNIKII